MRCIKITLDQLIDQSKFYTLLNIHPISRTCAQIAMQMAYGQTSHAVVLLAVRAGGWK
jgi:hypothetical protein